MGGWKGKQHRMTAALGNDDFSTKSNQSIKEGLPWEKAAGQSCAKINKCKTHYEQALVYQGEDKWESSFDFCLSPALVRYRSCSLNSKGYPHPKMICNAVQLFQYTKRIQNTPHYLQLKFNSKGWVFKMKLRNFVTGVNRTGLLKAAWNVQVRKSSLTLILFF